MFNILAPSPHPDPSSQLNSATRVESFLRKASVGDGKYATCPALPQDMLEIVLAPKMDLFSRLKCKGFPCKSIVPVAARAYGLQPPTRFDDLFFFEFFIMLIFFIMS